MYLWRRCKKFASFVGGALLACGFVASAAASQVAVLAGGSPPVEIGQGLLTRSMDQCRLLMPSHVVSQGGVQFRREGRQPVFGAMRNARDLGDDLSLLEVDGVPGQQCGESMSVLPRAVDALLRGVGTAHLRFVNGDGTIGSMAVAIVDNDLHTHLRIKPVVEGERISRGMSGSLLMANGTSIGMLLSVNARSGVATVLRQDAMLRKAEASLREGVPGPSQAVAAEGQPLLKLLAWDAPPVGAVLPEDLVTGIGSEPWRVAYADKPVALDFELRTPGGVWSGVRIDVQGIPVNERPDVVELLMGSGSNSTSWVSVKTSRLEYANDVAVVQVAPRKGMMLRLRLSHATPKDAPSRPEALAVRHIAVLP